MKEEFKQIYNQLKNKYGEKYKPLVSQNIKRICLRIFVAWLVLSTTQIFYKRVAVEGTAIYTFLELLSTLSSFILFIIVIYIISRNFEYWKHSFEFKNEVGEEFWRLVNPKIKYQTNRNEIDKNYVKRELDNMLNDNVDIIDIEDYLAIENKKMYTVKYNTEDKKRVNGVFVIIENSNNNKSLEEYIRTNNLSIKKESIKIVEKDNKKYILLDAVEVFKFNNIDYFNEEELYYDYLRFNEIIEENWSNKEEL